MIRGERVLLDSDLADLCGIPTKRLNEQVRRNRRRFPSDFMFQLNAREHDYSRTFRTEFDLEGHRRAGERGRPMQAAVWYPAAKEAGASRAQFGVYIELLATEEGRVEMTDSVRRAAMRLFISSARRWLGEEPDGTAVINLLATETAAYKDAQPAPSRFPVVILAQGSSQSAFTHAILCEYLASNGFVVATSPSMGPRSREMPGDFRGAATQVQDMEFLVSLLQAGPVADMDRLGVAGFSFGGYAALLEAMRNPDVRALLSLDSNLGFAGTRAFLEGSSDFDIEALAVPLLHLSQTGVPGLSTQLIDTLRYSDRTVIHVSGMTHFDFSSFGLISALVPRFVKTVRPGQRAGYEAVCECALAFFRASLVSRSDVPFSFTTSGLPAPAIMTAEHRDGREPPPAYESFAEYILHNGIAEAAKLLTREKQRVPDGRLFQEATVNRLGYEFLYDYRMTKEAIEIFRWNVDAYPASFNVYDSLGEAYLADGQTELAARNYRKSVELNPQNTNGIDVLKRLEQ